MSTPCKREVPPSSRPLTADERPRSGCVDVDGRVGAERAKRWSDEESNGVHVRCRRPGRRRARARLHQPARRPSRLEMRRQNIYLTLSSFGRET